MNEVEVKAKVSDTSTLIKKLGELGIKLSEPITQEDRIFIHKSLDVYNLPPVRIILRIRTQGDTTILTLKQHDKNELDNFEREVIVSDAKQAQDIITKLDYAEQDVLHVKKTRRKAKFNDLEICLDEVDELGTFIEVEKLTDEEDTSGIQDELFEFLLKLGVPKEARVTQGYDTLLKMKRSESKTPH